LRRTTGYFCGAVSEHTLMLATEWETWILWLFS